MKVLVLTFYYPPDLSAGSYRAQAIVQALQSEGPGDLTIDVITTMPNRYASFADSGCKVSESAGGATVAVNVERLPVTNHHSGLLDQCLCFAGFAVRALRRVRGNDYDLVLATSSRLFTAYLGALIARRTGARLYLDIRDLFVETMADLFRHRPLIRLLVPLLARIERFTVARAARVNLVSQEFLGYCAKRFPGVEFANFTNGIDPEFLDFDYAKPAHSGPRTVLYAGNIGLGQGLEHIIPEAARLLGGETTFRIIGDGGRREALVAAVRDSALTNVEILPPVDRDVLRQEYRNADVLLMHLNDAPALQRVLPSKIFEYAASGKPIVAGVRGHARSFIDAEVANARVFDPCDASGLVAALDAVAPGLTDRSAFERAYSRETIMRAMALDVLQTV
jgi:glycosyltransferase involved in cell wall biosynthesis